MSKETTASFVQVFQGMNPTEPYLLKDWLRSNGIGAEVRGFDLMSALGEVPATFGGYPSVWVPPQCVKQAIALIDQFFAAESEQTSWVCRGCNENNPGGFGSCWNCGADHPSLG